MDVVFADDQLDRLETDPTFTMGLAPAVVTAYRRRLQAMRAAVDDRDLRVIPSWHVEKLKGKRQHQHSLRLNAQYRLIFEIGIGATGRCLRIVGIENYH